MKKTALILAILASALCMSSCNTDSTILYSDLCMVNVESPSKLITDAGLTYNIVESSVSAIPDTVKRVMILCDVLEQSGASTEEYNIRLLNFAHVLTKQPVMKSTVDEEVIGSDGITPAQLWLGGEYLNGAIQFTSVINSKVSHTVNLVFDDTRSNSDTLYFSLHHNAHGESLENDEIPQSTLTVSSDYVSFPVTEYIPEGKDGIVLHLDWSWYKEEFGYLVKEKALHSFDFQLKK